MEQLLQLRKQVEESEGDDLMKQEDGFMMQAGRGLG
jgi:hypothetical protein